MSHEDDLIYYDALISNVENNNNVEPDLVFNENREDALVGDPGNYKFSITRFVVDTLTLPVFIPTIMSTRNQGDTVDLNKTIYSVTVVYGTDASNVLKQEYLQYVPQDSINTNSAPSMLSNGYPNYSTGYYNIYSTQYFVKLVNTALQTAIKGLSGTDPDGAPWSSSAQPLAFFSYDPSTQLITLNAPKSLYDSSNSDLSNTIRIYMNHSMYRLFNSLPAIFTTDSDANGKIFQVHTNSFVGTSFYSLGNAPLINGGESSTNIDVLAVNQEYVTTDTWSPVSSIVFTSNSIPIVSSDVSAVHQFINGQETTTGSTNIVEMTVTDFATADGFLPGVYYVPEAQYRWISLKSSGPLRNINLSVHWRNKKDGFLVPLRLSAGGSCSVKMLFKRIASD